MEKIKFERGYKFDELTRWFNTATSPRTNKDQIILNEDKVISLIYTCILFDLGQN